jgi:hypothetical protein
MKCPKPGSLAYSDLLNQEAGREEINPAFFFLRKKPPPLALGRSGFCLFVLAIILAIFLTSQREKTLGNSKLFV